MWECVQTDMYVTVLFNVWEPTLSGRFVVARVEGGSESGRRIRDVSVEMAASTAICEHSHAQYQYDT